MMLQEPPANQTMPVPEPTLDSQAFWDACNRHELLVQQCERCEAYQYPPGPLCWRCQSFDLAWRLSTGRGVVHSWVVPHHPVHPMVKEIVPYVVALVELEEGPRVVARLLDVPLNQVRADLPVEVTFTAIADGVNVPAFQPRAGDR